MRLAGLVLAIATCAPDALANKGAGPDPVKDCTIRMDASEDMRRVLPRQYGLELRRAGGPRPEVAQRLLKTMIATNTGLLNGLPALLALDACQRRLTRCKDLLAAVDAHPPTSEASRVWWDHIRAALAKEAKLDAMPADEKRDYDESHLDSPDDIRRALADSFPVLVVAASQQAEWTDMTRNAGHPWVLVADALAHPDPISPLAQIVRGGATHEVRMKLDPPPNAKWEAPIVLASYVALDALRRIGDPRAIEPLKQARDFYEPVRMRDRRRPRAPGVRLPGRAEYLGLLGRKIVEAIGDLGDREFERQKLGCSLWDRVDETERALVTAHRITRADRVTE